MHCEIYYRTCATIGRSRLVAAPLCFQAKKHFLCAFYVVILRQKISLFRIEAAANSGAGTVPI